MNKKISCALLVSFVLLLPAFSNPFGFSYDFTMGYASYGFGGYETTNQYTKKVILIEDEVLYQQFSMRGWLFKVFYIGGSTTIQTVPIKRNGYFDIPQFKPTFTNYSFESGFLIKNVNIFFSHDCAHPQDVYGYKSKVTSLWGEGAVSRFGVKISGQIGSVGI